MTISVYQIGDAARCIATFTDDDGAAVDPATVTFRWTTPAGVSDSYVYGTDAEVVRDATGLFHVDLPVTERGLWLYRWESSGTAQAAEKGEFMAEPG